MIARSVLAVLAGTAISAFGRVAAAVCAGLATCPDPDPEYTEYLVGKGYTVDGLLCPNTVPGIRLWAALLVFCLVTLFSGYVVGALSKRSPIAHSVVGAALYIQLTELLALWLGRMNAETIKAVLLYTVPAIPLAAIGGYLASRRHA